jgi:Putative peptidoglycan binding domain
MKIDATRAREIQEALIREHYLDGTPSGTWDAKSQKAMQRFQVDNGWQSKSVPDSRALIKLGLGPDHEHLLNPETAMTSLPEPPQSTPALEPSSSMETQAQK